MRGIVAAPPLGEDPVGMARGRSMKIRSWMRNISVSVLITGVNVGAGSITCNYDGQNKWPCRWQQAAAA
jgi:bifunctional N-acetylglucosamine-1-phosphate-uridyltransferase/glucosamine-1-phosphate-acetyltransferase GlmU-like protein